MLCPHTGPFLGWICSPCSICHSYWGLRGHSFRRSRRHITHSYTSQVVNWNRSHRSICRTPQRPTLHIPHSVASGIFHQRTSVIMVRSSSLRHISRSPSCPPQRKHHKTQSGNCYTRGPIRPIDSHDIKPGSRRVARRQTRLESWWARSWFDTYSVWRRFCDAPPHYTERQRWLPISLSFLVCIFRSRTCRTPGWYQLSLWV